jgi:hypothetical protein
VTFRSTNPVDGLASIRVSLAQLIYRGVNVTIAERDTRKRLLINRHIAKMTPGEIARRFSVVVTVKAKGQSGN